MDNIKVKELFDKISLSLPDKDKNLVVELKKLIFNQDTPSYITRIPSILSNPRYKDEFYSYLSKERHITDTSIDMYFDSLKKVQEIIEYTYSILIPFSLYTVTDLDWFNDLVNDFESDQKNINLNLKWHHLLSAAYNNYKKFLQFKKNSFKKVILNNKTIFFCDLNNKKICRKPSNSNMKQIGSDNSLYFGIKDESIMYDLIKGILNVDDDHFNQKYIMKAYNQNVEVETNLNKQNQVQVKINGDGKMATLFNIYQIKLMETINPENVYICVDFNLKEISFIQESEINA